MVFEGQIGGQQQDPYLRELNAALLSSNEYQSPQATTQYSLPNISRMQAPHIRTEPLMELLTSGPEDSRELFKRKPLTSGPQELPQSLHTAPNVYVLVP